MTKAKEVMGCCQCGLMCCGILVIERRFWGIGRLGGDEGEDLFQGGAVLARI